MSEAYITHIARFLPNEPVSNDEMEQYLGYINGKPSRSKQIVLRNNGIKNRYYSFNKQGETTHSNADMAAAAIRNLFKDDPERLASVDLLSVGTSSPDQIMPSHGVMVHGKLPETKSVEVVSPSGVCCAGMHALKYAWMSVRLGEKKMAVSAASERFAISLRHEQFEDEVQKLIELEQNPYIAFDKDFLRWMLSDGAGAVLVQDQASPVGLSLRIDWIEGCSYANQEEVCMYMAGEKGEEGEFKSFKDYSPDGIKENSLLSIKQDFKMLKEKIVPLGFNKMKSVLESKNVPSGEIDHFLPHISSFFFQDKIFEVLEANGTPIPMEKWFINLDRVGNVGAASVYLMLEELFNSGKLKQGEKILLAVPESARFSYVFALLTVV